MRTHFILETSKHVSDAQKSFLFKEFGLEKLVKTDIVKTYKVHHKVDPNEAWSSIAERARKEFAPYPAILITDSMSDQTNLVELFTEDSMVIVKDARQDSHGVWHNNNRIFDKDGYLDWIEERYAQGRIRYWDEDTQFEWEVLLSELDLVTDNINLVENRQERLNRAVEAQFRPATEIHVNVDNFDPVKVTETIEITGQSKKEKIRKGRAGYTKEYIQQTLETAQAILEWIDKLEAEGSHETAEEVRKMYRPMNAKKCPDCGHYYSVERAKCPICWSENEDNPFNYDVNVEWF